MTDSFTSVFGGSPVQPSEVAYRAIALTASVVLFWPQQSVDTTDIVARWNDVTPSGAGLTITLGAATAISTGQDAVFNNLGSNAFTVLANDGTTIASVSPGIAIYIINTSNSTAAGSWRVTTFAAGTSQAQASSLAGAGLLAIAATLNLNILVQTIAADYPSIAGDRATVLNWTGGAGTITLADAGTLGNGWIVEIRNSGTGALTLASSGGTIDSNATKTYNQGESSLIHTDGMNFFSVGFGQSVVSAFTQLVVSVAGSSDVNLTSAQAQNQVLTFTGALTGDINVTVPANVAEYFVYNNTTGAHSLTFKTAAGGGELLTQGVRRITHCDGTNIVFSDTLGTGTVTQVNTGTGLTGGPITATGTIAIAATAVTAGNYTNANISVNAQGQLTAAANGTGALLAIRAFGTPGSSVYTPTAGTNSVVVYCLGAGGGGGGVAATSSSQLAAAGGGGAGGLAAARITSAFSGVTLTVGAGGAGGVVGVSNGATGGTTSFGGLLSATGGAGALNVGPASGVVGVPTNGSGAAGGSGLYFNATSNGAEGSSALLFTSGASSGGGGGMSLWGAGGRRQFASGAGNVALSYGSGGGGALNLVSQPNHNGAAGATGLIVIYEYS